jgi:hypothetical protein
MSRRLPWLPRRGRGEDVGLRWLAVLDSSVYVAALLTINPRSPNRETIELGLAGVYILGTSEYIKGEVEEALLGEAGLQPEDVHTALSSVWRIARWLDPVDDSPIFAAAVRDEADRPILRAALGAYSVADLAPLPEKFLISENTRHFIPGRNLYGFVCTTPGGFLARIRRAGQGGSSRS